MSTSAKRLFWISLIGTIAAVATHVYLTKHHYEFKYGQGSDGGICNISSTINCDMTTASSYSEFFGIPVSILGGLINFAFLLFLIGWRFPVVKPETQRALGGTLKLMASGIFAASVVMAVLSYGVLKTVCPACTTAYVLSLIVLISTWMMTEKGSLFSKLDVKLYPITAITILLFAIFINRNSLSSYNADDLDEMAQLQYEQWTMNPEKTVSPANALVKNPNPDAKMKIVEFADFLCGHCAHAFPLIKQFMSKHDDVEFSFQAWPLDGECNKAIPHSEGTRCLLARISQCAGQQGKPWETQEWIFKNQASLLSKEQVTAQLKENADSLGLSYEDLMACQDTDEIREIIRSQSNVGNDLNISGTPTLYVNGRKVPPGFSVPLLEKMYREIKKSAK